MTRIDKNNSLGHERTQPFRSKRSHYSLRPATKKAMSRSRK